MSPPEPLTHPDIQDFRQAFLAQRPIRAWSLIISIFGDCVVPRGGEIWLGSLLDIMELFGVGGGVVRTAMSRLAGDGWLERAKQGRHSYYRLSDKGRETFLAATRRIYDPMTSARWDFQWQMVMLTAPQGERADVRKRLKKEGFGVLAPNVLMRPLHITENADPAHIAGLDQEVFVVEGKGYPLNSAGPLVRQAWELDELADDYHAFIAQFANLDAVLHQGVELSEAEALVARIYLIHQFRRIVLRDPHLPEQLLATDWPGQAARELTARLYRALLVPSERWLDLHGQDSTGPLLARNDALHTRFQKH